MDINQHWPFIQSLLTLGIMVIGATLFVIWIFRRRARGCRNPPLEAEYLRAGFKVETSWWHGGPVVSGTLHATPFLLKALPGTDTATTMTVISVPITLGRVFSVSPGRNKTLSESDLREPVFADEKARSAVHALFRLGFTTVGGRDRNLSAIRHAKAELPQLDALRASVEHLAVIGKSGEQLP